MRGRVRPLLCASVGAAALFTLVYGGSRLGATYVAGSSMRPFAAAGDLAVYARGSSGLHAGDVVLYRRADGARVLHRAVLVTGDGTLTTRGDASRVADAERVRRADVEGVVMLVVPSGRVIDTMASGVRWCYNHVPIANTRR